MEDSSWGILTRKDPVLKCVCVYICTVYVQFYVKKNYEILANFNLAVIKIDRQTAKFSVYMVGILKVQGL